jgi:hypothetical protein
LIQINATAARVAPCCRHGQPPAPEHRHEKYQRLIAAAQSLPPITVAVMHLSDHASL